MKVLVFGGTGVIGKQIVSSLSSNGLDVTSVSRGIISCEENIPKIKYIKSDLSRASDDELTSLMSEHSYLVNAAGVVKQRISPTNYSTQLEAVILNSELPFRLASLSEIVPIRILHITTDCVFNGLTGNYDENSSHSALDIYGKSKSLGEVRGDNIFNIRCSVIGPDSTSLSLAGWVRCQEVNARVIGYLNHFWNGITTYSLSKIVLGFIESGYWKSGTQHLIPVDSWTKFKLVQELVKVYNRQDLTVDRGYDKQGVNRILQTVDPKLNSTLWKLGGYRDCPSINELFEEPIFRNSF
jgi:dTDP-4-dehydrorhamnose reductase